MKSYFNYIQTLYQIPSTLVAKMEAAYDLVQPAWRDIEAVTGYNQIKVLRAFQDNHAGDFHLHGSTGYGYGDTGRDVLEEIWADIFCGEKALVRSNMVSGTHAIAVGLFGLLRPGDELLSISGLPYDTLLQVIGQSPEEAGTLAELGITHRVVDLVDDCFDLAAIKKSINKNTKVVSIQRSRGYNWRKSLSIAEIGRAVAFVKEIDPNLIVYVDNCYGEFVEAREPLEVGADLLAGSLIKNPGGALAPRGGYLVGRADLIELAGYRLTAPGIAGDVGAALDFNRPAFQGLFMAPLIVEQALKGAAFAAALLEDLGYEVSPRALEARTDIIQAIKFGDPDKVRKFSQGIQKGSPLEAYVTPYDAQLPGYADPVIMAGGTFIQGSSIELSVDGPIRPPYIAYLQGGLSVHHVMAGVAIALSGMEGY